MAQRSDTQDGNKPGETMDEVPVSQKETWDVLKGKENPLRNLGKLKLVRGKDYNAGDREGTITSKTDRAAREAELLQAQGRAAQRKFKRAGREK